MDKQIIEMAFALSIIILPLIIVFGFVYKIKLKEIESKVDNSEKVQFQAEIASMKHRIMTLERIVTDKGYQLDDEISKLKSVKQ